MKFADRWKIIRTLRSLEMENEVDVTVSKKRTVIWIIPKRERALHFKFELIAHNHFAGYVRYFAKSKWKEWKEWKESQAVVALWNNLDAKQFAGAYRVLANLRANRRILLNK